MLQDECDELRTLTGHEDGRGLGAVDMLTIGVVRVIAVAGRIAPR